MLIISVVCVSTTSRADIACLRANDCDGDGVVNIIDEDDDNDGICDKNKMPTQPGESCVPVPGGDILPLDPTECVDLDKDGCDDCRIGVDRFGYMPDHDIFRDGPDSNADGECEPDQDFDGVSDIDDIAPNDGRRCGDVPYEDGVRPVDPVTGLAAEDNADNDGCDDCALTGPNRSGGNRYDDGPDRDADGECDASDPDDDNDGIADADDSCPTGDIGWTSSSFSDHDQDGCQDSLEDTDDDNDGLPDSVDPAPLEAASCLDAQSGPMDCEQLRVTDGCQARASTWLWLSALIVMITLIAQVLRRSSLADGPKP